MLVLPESPAEVSADRVGRNRGRHFEAHTHELPGVDAEPARLTRRARTGALEDCDARGRGREQRERRATSEHAAGLDPHEPPLDFEMPPCSSADRDTGCFFVPLLIDRGMRFA